MAGRDEDKEIKMFGWFNFSSAADGTYNIEREKYRERDRWNDANPVSHTVGK